MWNYTLENTRRLVTLPSCPLVTCHASWLLSHLSSCCPLVLSSHHHLVFSPRLSSSSHCTALSSSHCAGWLLLRRLSLRCRLVLSTRRTLVHLLSYHCAAASPSHRAVWLLRCLSSCCHLVLSSSSHCAALSSSNYAGWLLRRLSLRRRLVLLSCHPLVLLSSSRCAALSLSNRAIWMLPHLSSCHRLVLLLSSHCNILSPSCACWLLCCLSLRHPLVLSWHCPLVLLLRAR